MPKLLYCKQRGENMSTQKLHARELNHGDEPSCGCNYGIMDVCCGFYIMELTTVGCTPKIERARSLGMF